MFLVSHLVTAQPLSTGYRLCFPGAETAGALPLVSAKNAGIYTMPVFTTT